jgi:hypothetical protein
MRAWRTQTEKGAEGSVADESEKADHELECLRYDLQIVIPQLQTPRLYLRPLMLADAHQTQLLFPHWEIVRYLSSVVPWPYPPDGAYTHYRDAARRCTALDPQA